MNLDQVMKAKEGSVKGLTGGIAHLFKKNGVTRVEGHGSLAGPNKDRFISTVVSDQWSPPKKLTTWKNTQFYIVWSILGHYVMVTY